MEIYLILYYKNVKNITLYEYKDSLINEKTVELQSQSNYWPNPKTRPAGRYLLDIPKNLRNRFRSWKSPQVSICYVL